MTAAQAPSSRHEPRIPPASRHDEGLHREWWSRFFVEWGFVVALNTLYEGAPVARDLSLGNCVTLKAAIVGNYSCRVGLKSFRRRAELAYCAGEVPMDAVKSRVKCA